MHVRLENKCKIKYFNVKVLWTDCVALKKYILLTWTKNQCSKSSGKLVPKN